MGAKAQAFLNGLRSATVVKPTWVPVYNGWAGLASREGVADALHSDWLRVGGDFSVAISKAKESQNGEGSSEKAREAGRD